MRIHDALLTRKLKTVEFGGKGVVIRSANNANLPLGKLRPKVNQVAKNSSIFPRQKKFWAAHAGGFARREDNGSEIEPGSHYPESLADENLKCKIQNENRAGDDWEYRKPTLWPSAVSTSNPTNAHSGKNARLNSQSH
jgi:hypothetical protein